MNYNYLIYLSLLFNYITPVFTHEELYVGHSSVTTKVGIKIIQGNDQKIGKVKNIVYKEMYNGLPHLPGNPLLFATQYTTLSKNTKLLSLPPPVSGSDAHPDQAPRNHQQLSIS